MPPSATRSCLTNTNAACTLRRKRCTSYTFLNVFVWPTPIPLNPSTPIKAPCYKLSILRIVQILAQDFIHRKHVHLVALEHRAQLVVASYLPLVVRILQLVLSDVLPDALDGLRARELRFVVQECGQGSGEEEGFLGRMSVAWTGEQRRQVRG